MKGFRQRMKGLGHQGLRLFVRLRLPTALAFVVVFGAYEVCRHYRTSLGGLPTAIRQDVVDGWDDFHGQSDLQRPAEELKAKADGGHAFAQYVYALRRTDRLPKEYRIAPVDLKVARIYFAKAADGGLTRAKAVLASYLQRDLLADPQARVDRKLMEAYAKEAAENQDALGRRVWADIKLEQAKKTQPADRELEQEAYRLLLSSAERGTRTALRKVGELYFEGRQGFTDEAGRPILVQNFRLGLASYEQAALTRDFEASARLADLYEGNQFAPADEVKAYAWALVAMQLAPRNVEASVQPDPAQLKRQRDEAAKKAAVALKLEELPSRLSPADLIVAQDLANSLLLRMPTEKEYVERIILKAR